MTVGRMSKALARRLTISWRQQPNQSDIDALDANVARVGLVVAVRWTIVAALVVFTVVASAIYVLDGEFSHIGPRMVVPAAALGLVLIYNTYCQLNYRRLANISLFNEAQLLLDIAVVTVIIYYSGSAFSWFNSMYLLFVLEAALVLPSSKQVFSIAFAAWAAYAALLAGVYLGVLPHSTVPVLRTEIHFPSSYVIVRALWEFTILAGAAAVGGFMMKQVREHEQRLASDSGRDARTGLFDRTSFRRELGREIERARRDNRGVSVALADIDGLERFNNMFGVDAGNTMIVKVAKAIEEAVAATGGPFADLVVVARYGGEEFAIVAPEAFPGDVRDGMALAEAMRAAVADVRDEDRSVTVSVGMSAYPTDGRSAAELMASADIALGEAKEAGGNRVVGRRIAERAVL